MEQRQPLEKRPLPSFAGSGARAQLAHPACCPRGLRVDQTPGLMIEELEAFAGRRGDADTHKIFGPRFQVRQAGFHTVPALPSPFSAGGRIGRGCRSLRLLGYLCGPCLSRGTPFDDPSGRRRGGDRLFDVQQQQAERVFAGKLSAGTGALGRQIAQVDADLIGQLAAPLALSPQPLAITAARHPLAVLAQFLPALGRRGIGG